MYIYMHCVCVRVCWYKGFSHSFVEGQKYMARKLYTRGKNLKSSGIGTWDKGRENFMWIQGERMMNKVDKTELET